MPDFDGAGREMDVNLGIASLAATERGLVTIMYIARFGFEKGFAGAIVGVIMALDAPMLTKGVKKSCHAGDFRLVCHGISKTAVAQP